MTDGLENLDAGDSRYIVQCIILEVCSEIIRRIIELSYYPVSSKSCNQCDSCTLCVDICSYPEGRDITKNTVFGY